MSLDALAELFATTIPPAPDAPEPTAADFAAQFTPKEWAALQRHPDILQALRTAFELARERRAGIIPKNYTAAIVCKVCGPVPIWPGAPAQVLGCPWCANRADGLPIPRPTPSAGGRPDSEPMSTDDL